MTATAVDRTYIETVTQGCTEIDVEAHALDFAVQARRDGPTWVVAVRGELDLATVPLLRSVLGTVCDRFPPRVEVDMSAVTFVDCFALTSLADAQGTLPAGSRLMLRDPSPIVTRVLTLTGLRAALELTSASEPPVSSARRAS